MGGATLSFSSLIFIFRFLPFFLILYYIFPCKYRNIILFLGSLCFYAAGEPKYILLILLSVLFNYVAALHLNKYDRNQSLRKVWFLVTLSYDLGILFFFKYFDFFIQNINSLIINLTHLNGIPVQTSSIALPLGISFYTFQIVSYIIDVYSNKVKAEKSFLNIGIYHCMFPQLISGPIVSYSHIMPQIKYRTYNLKDLESGLKLFIIGLGFKVLIANKIGVLWSDIQTIGFESISTPLAWIGMYGYSLQLYFDFQGYSLMAIGVGKMLGFSLPENFNHPYMSKSVTEFWRRWHITLGKWFKTYVYIPMGGNREGNIRLAINLLVVWLLTGLWHGASWNFLLWGFALFLLILIEKMFLKSKLDKSNFIARIYVLTIIPMTWMLFAISKFHDIKIYLYRLLSINSGINVNAKDFVKYLSIYKWLFIIGIFFCMPLAKKWYQKYDKSIPCIIFLFIIFWYSIYQLVNGLNNPFLYFKF